MAAAQPGENGFSEASLRCPSRRTKNDAGPGSEWPWEPSALGGRVEENFAQGPRYGGTKTASLVPFRERQGENLHQGKKIIMAGVMFLIILYLGICCFAMGALQAL